MTEDIATMFADSSALRQVEEARRHPSTLSSVNRSDLLPSVERRTFDTSNAQSAKVAETRDPEQALPAASKSQRDIVQDLVETVVDNYRDIYFYTTPHQKDIIRGAVSPPTALIPSLYISPLQTVIVSCIISFIAGTLLSPTHMFRRDMQYPFRGISDSCQSVIDKMTQFM